MYNVRGLEICSRLGQSEWETFRRAKCGGLDASPLGRPVGTTCGTPVAATDAVTGRGGEAHGRRGVARRQAHHERMRDERAREAAAGDAELPPEDDAVEMASAAQLLDSVAEVGPNYTLLRSYLKSSGLPEKYLDAGR